MPEEVDGKTRLVGEQILISNLYLCLGEKRQEEFHKRRPHLELVGDARYPRVLDAMEGEFKKERNETYEKFQMLSRKRRIGESLEQFHAVLSGLVACRSFGTLESRVLRDVFIVNMTNREAQNELCRATKTPEEAYWIALSYARGDKKLKLMLRSEAQRPAVPEAAEYKSGRNRWEPFEEDIEVIGGEDAAKRKAKDRTEGA